MPDNRSRTRPPQRQLPRSASRRKRERRRELARTQYQPSRRFGRLAVVGGGVVAAAAVAVLLSVLLTRGGSTTPQPSAQPSATPVPTPTAQPLAALSSAASGSAIDGMQCAASESTTNKLAAHLAIFVDGSARQVPAGVGIPSPAPAISTDAGPFIAGGKCFYPLLTHTTEGIILVQPPAPASFTLGNFFDLWGQPLTAGQVGPATGTLTVYVDGAKYSGDPRAIPISKHAVIQLDVGMDTPPQPFTFPPAE